MGASIGRAPQDIADAVSSRRRLQAPPLPNQQAEAKIDSNVLNRMTNLGMLISVPIK
jgi:hypothetical protein